jgi:diketogulonate reductase-like aldo/keto reductase
MTDQAPAIRTVTLPTGQQIPVLGQGTWGMGEDPAQRKTEVAALQLGLDLGMTLIDTAEMYGEGGAEEVVSEALAGRRPESYLVSKFYPHHASRQGVVEACQRSLRRLRTDYLDMYLLHWRGSVPLEETLEGLQSLKQSGAILDYGVSNFDTDDMEEIYALPGGSEVATNQVLYNLVHRGTEWDLLPWCRQHQLPVMAYSPIEHAADEQRGMLDHPVVLEIARRHAATPVQIALAWLLQQDNIIAIPKAASPAHVRENRQALDLALTPEDNRQLDQAFPPPHRKTPLAMR